MWAFSSQTLKLGKEPWKHFSSTIFLHEKGGEHYSNIVNDCQGFMALFPKYADEVKFYLQSSWTSIIVAEQEVSNVINCYIP